MGDLGRHRGKDGGFPAVDDMVNLSARSRNIAARAVVGIIRRQAVRTERRDADDIVEAARIVGVIVVVIAGGKNGDTSVQNRIVLGLFEIMDRIDFRRSGRLDIVIVRKKGIFIAKRAGNDGSSHVGRILDGPGNRRIEAGIIAGENLAAHNAAAVPFSGSAGHPAYTLAVVVHGGDGASAMGSMARISISVPGNGTLGIKIIPVDIIDVAVSVIVDTVAGNLTGIDPHVVLQVGMRAFHAFVHHSYDDVRIAAGEVGPDISHIDVGTGHRRLGNGHITIVFVMPLVGQIRVVEQGRGIRSPGRGSIYVTAILNCK